MTTRPRVINLQDQITGETGRYTLVYDHNQNGHIVHSITEGWTRFVEYGTCSLPTSKNIIAAATARLD